MKVITIIVILANYLMAEYYLRCNIDYKIMRYIAQVERSIHRDIGYPYIISFNKNIEIDIPFEYKKLDNRSIDCLTKENCIEITNFLLNEKITNLDLGAFQLNYIWNKIAIYKYFVLNDSYMRACENIESLIDRYGYSWETIAKYHSFRKIHRDKYLKLISNVYLKNKK